MSALNEPPLTLWSPPGTWVFLRAFQFWYQCPESIVSFEESQSDQLPLWSSQAEHHQVHTQSMFLNFSFVSRRINSFYPNRFCQIRLIILQQIGLWFCQLQNWTGWWCVFEWDLSYHTSGCQFSASKFCLSSFWLIWPSLRACYHQLHPFFLG